MIALVDRALFAVLGSWLLIAVLRATKFEEWEISAALAREDLGIAAAIALTCVGAGAMQPYAGAALGLGALLLVAALWLDALLFRTFTIELGPGGAAGVVPSVLLRELLGMAHARRFLRSALVFDTLWPAALALAAAMVDRRARLAFIAWGVLAVAGPLRRGWLSGALLVAGLVTLGFGATWPLIAGGIACAVGCVLLAHGEGPAVIRPFFVPRSEPAPEPAAPETRTSAPSASHGLLRGADVVLLTVESMGQAHVGGDGARLPLLERLAEGGLSSRHHFCICALTNEAHATIYGSAYAMPERFAPLEALAAAGYARAYATTVDTRQYGLRAILDRAGFTVVDASDLGPSPTDRLLPGPVVEKLAQRLGERRPLFLHVHTANSHLPYHVDDPRFSRFDAHDDRGRYLNSLEEAGERLNELLRALERAGLVRDPLVILTADHGQTFGQLGYRSHGSAVVSEQMLVPFAMAHPKLRHAVVEHSSHLDVLPTVLDLLGLDPGPVQGRSLLAPAVSPWLVLWAGRPSRNTTSNFGLVDGPRKFMVDTVLDRVHEMGWNGGGARRLEGEEKRQVKARVTEAFRRSGLR